MAGQAPPAGGASSVEGRALAVDTRVIVAGASEQFVPRLRGVSHAVASVASVAAAIVVVALAPAGRTTVALAVYGVGLVALFGCSAIYHRWPGPYRFKPLLQRIDHSTIYVFIAASYTPIAVLMLHGALVWMILVVAWAGAAAGVAFTLGWIEAPRAVVAGSCLGARMARRDRTPATPPGARTRPTPLARRRRAALLRRGDRVRNTATGSLAADVWLS